MKKPEKKLSAKETLEILNNQWADIHDVMKLGFIGNTKAQRVMREIRVEINKTGKTLPNQLVPMEKVKEYFNINVTYLKKVADD